MIRRKANPASKILHQIKLLPGFVWPGEAYSLCIRFKLDDDAEAKYWDEMVPTDLGPSGLVLSSPTWKCTKVSIKNTVTGKWEDGVLEFRTLGQSKFSSQLA
jgi:hypothetical protein